MRFRATIRLEGKTATGIPVPAEIVHRLGKGKRPPVRVTVGAHTYRSTVAAYGDVFMLPLSGENREAAGVAAGEEVDVDVELDTEPRTVEVPNRLRGGARRRARNEAVLRGALVQPAALARAVDRWGQVRRDTTTSQRQVDGDAAGGPLALSAR